MSKEISAIKEIKKFVLDLKDKLTQYSDENTLLSEKIKSFAHSEYNKPEFTDVDNIKKKINLKKDLYGRDFTFEKMTNINDLPEYIIQNQKKFSEFLI